MKIISAIAFIRDLDLGEEDWHVFLAFAEGTSEDAIKSAILAKLQASVEEWGVGDYADLTMADMDMDGRICWQTELVEVAGV